MMGKSAKNKFLFLNFGICLFFLLLPYFLFQGKYYISGDDTRLYYIYPWKYFTEWTFSSWHHYSSVGSNTATQFMVPFLLIWALLDIIIPSKIILGYLGFSLPIILGFIFFQLFLKEIIAGGNSKLPIILGSLFLVTSPIMLINQYFIFLSTIWLLPLIPLLSFLFLKYVKTGLYVYSGLAAISSAIFSLSLFSIPWLLGYLIPIGFGIALLIYRHRIKHVSIYTKRTIVFSLSLFLVNFFWLFPFMITYLGNTDINFGSKILSEEVANTFAPTVNSTATGNVIYPLLNLFHRSIPFDFGWHLKDVFSSYYDKTYFINIIFTIIIFSGLFIYKKHLSQNQQNAYILITFCFTITLFFLTVNIGPLKQIFIFMGNIPGFVMFRNFFDKFALAYVLFFATAIAFSLVMIRSYNINLYKITVCFFICVVLLNFTQIGPIVNAPLWQTENVGRNIIIPNEYTKFMDQVGKLISSSNNIFTIPFGTASYSVIKDENSDNVYTGTSPVKLFSGVNDISGFLSFYFSETNRVIEEMIINRDYEGLNEIFYFYNINYIFKNKNIPENVKNTWIFDKRINQSLNDSFIKTVTNNRPILTSEFGNYLLYKLEKQNTLISSKNLTFQKINEVKFRVFIKNISEKQALYFHDSVHPGWKFYPAKNSYLNWCRDAKTLNGVTECMENKEFVGLQDLLYLFQKPIFSGSHNAYSKYNINEWTINPEEIKLLPKKFYKKNNDGTYDIELILYFLPQSYFYVGSIVSVLFLIFCVLYFFKELLNKYRK